LRVTVDGELWPVFAYAIDTAGGLVLSRTRCAS
jgi:hypothetical protein